MNLQESIDKFMEEVRRIWSGVKKAVDKFTSFIKRLYTKAKLRYGNKRAKGMAYRALYSKKYRVRKKNFRMLLRC